MTVGPVARESIVLDENYGRLESMVATYDELDPAGATASARAKAALDAAATQYGDALSADSNLICVKRSAKYVQGSDNRWAVTLGFVPDGTRMDNFQFHGSGTITTINTTVDAFGQGLYVSHTYPNDHPVYPGQTLYQGGEVNVPEAIVEIKASGIVGVNNIATEVGQYMNAINSGPFFGEGPGYWRCVDCSFEPWNLKVSPKRYAVSYTFQFMRQAWYYTLYFKDPTSPGLAPPINLVPGVGIKTVQWHRSVNFNNISRHSVAP